MFVSPIPTIFEVAPVRSQQQCICTIDRHGVLRCRTPSVSVSGLTPDSIPIAKVCTIFVVATTLRLSAFSITAKSRRYLQVRSTVQVQGARKFNLVARLQRLADKIEQDWCVRFKRGDDRFRLKHARIPKVLSI
jgi:hypothetical protein